MSGDDFRPKRRKLVLEPEWRKQHLVDFAFENPMDGKFKDLEVVQQLLSDYFNMVKQVETSYCQYGYPYRKRTVFVSSLVGFKPVPPCPGMPCAQVALGKKHNAAVAEAETAQKNSLPPRLVDELVEAWLSRHRGNAKYFLFIDVFSGWGSVCQRIHVTHPEVKIFANDIVNRSHVNAALDMGADSLWDPNTLLAFAVLKLYPDDVACAAANPNGTLGWLRDEKVAVLFHCSTPCDTYSQNGLGKHRVKGTVEPKTDKAREADAMNAALIAYFKEVVLTPSPSPSQSQD